MKQRLRLGMGLVLALILTVTAALAGCASKNDGNSPGSSSESGNSSSGGKIQLELWDWWGDGQYKQVIEKIVDDFNKSQDKIEVKHVFYPWGDVWTKALAATAAGNPPDVIIQDINSVPSRAKAKQATDLQPYIEKEPCFKDKFYPQLWNATIYNGHSYGIPFTTDTRFLFYDKDAFKAAGLDPEKPPTTWDELLADARKLDDVSKDGKIKRLGFYPMAHTDWDIMAYNSDGKDFIDQQNHKAMINTPTKVAAIQWIYDNFIKYYGKKNIDAFTAEFGNDMSNPFVSGKVAMIVQTATEFTKVRDFAPDKNYGMAPIPERVKGSGHWSWGGGFTAEIPYGAKHPDASWEFIKYLTDKPAQTYWASQVYDSVANIEASKDPELLKNPVYKMATDNMQWTILTPTPLYAPNYMSLVKPNVDEVWLGKKTPQQAMDDSQKAVEDLIKQNS